MYTVPSIHVVRGTVKKKYESPQIFEYVLPYREREREIYIYIQAPISAERITIIKCKYYCNHVKKSGTTSVSIRRLSIIFLCTIT